MSSNRIIFLDVDGVLTSCDQIPGSFLNHLPDQYGLSAKCVQNLIELCKCSSSRIIISSNWRKFDLDGPKNGWTYNGHLYRNPLKEVNNVLASYIEGMLPPTRHQKKSVVLRDWMKDNQKSVESFVVFDDDLSEGFQDMDDFGISQNFIQIDFNHGLTIDDCTKAKSILLKQS